MKHHKSLAWTMAIAIASTVMTACSLDSNEPEKPFTTCPPSGTTLYACGISHSGTRSIGNVLFTEDDIEWFNITTREIKFIDKQSGKILWRYPQKKRELCGKRSQNEKNMSKQSDSGSVKPFAACGGFPVFHAGRIAAVDTVKLLGQYVSLQSLFY